MSKLENKPYDLADTITVHIRIPRGVRRAMQEAARLANMRTTDWVRWALEKALSFRGPKG